MAEKKKIIMRIGGRDYKVSGGESEEHLRQIETCVNGKLKELHTLFSVRSMEEENVTMLAAINLADDYLRAEKQLQQLKIKYEKLSRKERQLQEEVQRYEEALLNLEAENQDYAERLKKSQKGSDK